MTRPSTAARAWIALGVLAAAAVAVASRGQGETSSWVSVERRELPVTVPLNGRLRAVRVTEYGAPLVPKVWNYKISFLAPEGTEVEAGERILAFDTSELEERLRRNLSAREAAEESLKKRRQDLDVLLREEELALSEAQARGRKAELDGGLPEDVVARRDLQKSAIERGLAEREVGYRESRQEALERRGKAELNALEEQRRRAADEVAEIERSIGSMTVRAQRPGTVMYKTGFEGAKKQLGDTAWRGERLIEIPELGEMVVDATVVEAYAGLLAPGLPAELFLESDPRQTLRAVISTLQQTIERRSEQDPRKVVRLELAVTEAPASVVRPGMRVQGTIVVERRGRVVALPVAAVRRSAEGPFVLTRSWLGRTPRRALELGRRDGDWVEVVAGLEEGEQVLAPSR